MRQLEKNFDPKSIESEIYKKWEEKKLFKPEVNNDGKPYTIIMPPPNITGQLHIGHAFDFTLQDILIRYKRMCGFKALWVPGEDHASIATEVKVIEKIRNEEGLSKYDLGREGFLERAWQWSDFYRNRIATQARKIGCSCDWDRERFTMDKGLNDAVKEAFIRLYSKGLIYRANRIINWCPNCQTALSDAEVEYEEQPSYLWHIKYPIKDTDEYIVVATTRPETLFGDTGVAVNPNDDRYKHLIGKTVIVPLVNREVQIVGDEMVDLEFGTGFVKITPCHDPNDFETGLRHNLEQIRVFNYDGTLNEECGEKYNGLTTVEARPIVVKDLEDLGLMEKIVEHAHNVGTCYRCHTTVEPITSLQWFVKMQPLAEPAIKVVKDNETRFVPDRFKKIYFSWMENIKDWCISRQLWWGHRIPIFYCDDCNEIVASKEDACTCPKCGKAMRQDEDVLDTWFSSALWPFSTMGWPNETDDLKTYYPNDVLVTGFDIIFFWVARMMFSGIAYMGEAPFKDIYIHGLVRDALGRKMSKSLGNGVDPLDVIEKYGADAMRFALIIGNAAGNDTRWQEEKILSARNFTNKLNNAARFIIMNLEGYDTSYKADTESLSIYDKWIISKTNDLIAEVTANIDKYELGIALEKLYTFVWDEFCDWYIELAKSEFNSGDESKKKAAQYTAYTVFIDLLRLMHPFMPFITEEMYDALKDDGSMIIIEKWPVYKEENNFANEVEISSEIISAITSIRSARQEMDIAPSRKAKLYIETSDALKAIYEANANAFTSLASASEVHVNEKADHENALSVTTANSKYYIPLDDLIDKDKELARLTKEKEKAVKDISFLEAKINNPSFVAKAPEKVVNEMREKLEKANALLADIEAAIARL